MSGHDLAALAAAFDLTDSDIEAAAERIASQVNRMASLWRAAGTPELQARQSLRRVAKRHHVAMPTKGGFVQLVNRLGDPAWWRRSLRKRFRTVEHQAIARGAVHGKASPYVSHKGLRWHEANRRRQADLLASLEVLNVNTGEAIPLDQVIEASQANPANRRRAMMVQLKGIDATAAAKGHTAMMLTITAPSRMHARHHNGRANDRHDGSSPRQVKDYLHGVWKRAMRSLQHQGLKVYGLRAVEPHHDACPHFHVLVYCEPTQKAAILSTLRRYALEDSPDEPGATKHRFDVVPIDPAKGGALAYVAKYVSKSIDGEGLGTDTESDTSGADTARRVVAWARLWGIRQFQFFGVPPITPARELYRHNGEGLGSEGLSEAHLACKTNDYAAYLTACELHGIGFAVLYIERPSTRYAEEQTRAIHGLCAHAADLAQPLELKTRTETWCVQPRKVRTDDGLCLSWTRFNNCAQSNKSTTYEGLTASVGNARGHPRSDGRRRRPPAPPVP